MNKNLILCTFLSAPSLEDKELLTKGFGLRNEEFKTLLNYDVPSWQKCEFDQYDNLSAYYLLWRGDNGAVLAFTRLNPTKFSNYEGSMIDDLWPHAVNGNVPSGIDIYEGSRFVVAKELSNNPKLRSRIIDELVLGIMEFGLHAKANYIIGTMYKKVWHSLFTQRGWNVEFLGEEIDISTNNQPEKVIVGQKKVSVENYRKLQEILDIKGPILHIAPSTRFTEAGISHPTLREYGGDIYG